MKKLSLQVRRPRASGHMNKLTKAVVVAAAIAAPLAITTVPAYAGDCSTPGCAGEIYNMGPNTIRVTYAWGDPASWDKTVNAQQWAGCMYQSPNLRCDVDGIYTPAGYNIFCYQHGLHDWMVPYTATGWHKMGDTTKYDCERLPE